PTPEPDQRLDRVSGQERAPVEAEAQAAAGRLSLERDRGRILEPPGRVEHRAEVHVRAPQLLRPLLLLRDRDRLLQRRERLVELAEAPERAAEHGAGEALDPAVADLARECDRLARCGAGR